MNSKKRQVFAKGTTVGGTMSLLVCVAVSAYAIDSADVKAARHANGRTIISEESPKAKLTTPKGFQLIGSQKINLYGNAEAEQYVFAKSGTGNTVEGFYVL